VREWTKSATYSNIGKNGIYLTTKQQN
ncbi:hypothetical protein LCGC14_2155020, partial [marine sediment metagenome]